MPGPSPPRLLVDAPAGGAWNMAVDEVLLAAAAESGICTLRFYEWSEPTLSLGYFQSHRDRSAHRSSRACPLVRRASGGGAIVHDHELTYSLAVPLAHPLAADSMRLYRQVHETLAATLGRWQIAVELSPGQRHTVAAAEAFLCFQRRAPGDLVLTQLSSRAKRESPPQQPKITGSAQRRRQGAILQHGSILLARSEAAPELAGIAELTGVRLTAGELVEAWKPQLEAALQLVWEPRRLTAGELGAVRSLAIEKYDTAGWNLRR